jgi:hypothetical protein
MVLTSVRFNVNKDRLVLSENGVDHKILKIPIIKLTLPFPNRPLEPLVQGGVDIWTRVQYIHTQYKYKEGHWFEFLLYCHCELGPC